MRKKNLIITMMLTLALCVGTVSSVFAASYPGHEGGTPKLESVERNVDASQELKVEGVTFQFYKEVLTGKYKVLDTEGAKAALDSGAIFVDTMGAAADNIRIPGAIKTWAPLTSETWTDKNYNKDEFLKTVAQACGKKTVKNKKYYWNTKKKKWVTKKPSKKYYGKCTKKGDKNKGKKYYYTYKKVTDKSKKIVVYCGFTGCGRSHQGAMALVKDGYTNVYRYGGGISAWFDKYGYEGCEGAYVNAPI